MLENIAQNVCSSLIVARNVCLCLIIVRIAGTFVCMIRIHEVVLFSQSLHYQPCLVAFFASCRVDPAHSLSSAQFEKQPPDNMRKSNFFHFIISLYDSHQQPIQVQKAIFRDFYDTMMVSESMHAGGINDFTKSFFFRLLLTNVVAFLPKKFLNKVLIKSNVICNYYRDASTKISFYNFNYHFFFLGWSRVQEWTHLQTYVNIQ